VTIELIGDVAAYNHTTTTGSLYIDLLVPQFYLIRYYSNQSYDQRFYFFNLTNRSSTDISLVLLDNSSEGYDTITATVYDETNHFVEGAYIKVLRYYIDTNSYRIVEMSKTNFEGVTQLLQQKNEEFYKYIIEYPFGTIRKETEPMQPYTNSMNFQILLGTYTGEEYYNTQGVSYNLSFLLATNEFRLFWNDDRNALSEVCLHVDQITNFRNTTVSRTCQSGATGILYAAVTNTTGSTYQAHAYADFGSNEQFLDARYHTFKATNPLAGLGILAVILLTIVFACIGIWNIAVAVSLTPVPAMLASIAYIIPIPAYVTIPMEIVAIIIAVVISSRT